MPGGGSVSDPRRPFRDRDRPGRPVPGSPAATMGSPTTAGPSRGAPTPPGTGRPAPTSGTPPRPADKKPESSAPKVVTRVSIEDLQRLQQSGSPLTVESLLKKQQQRQQHVTPTPQVPASSRSAPVLDDLDDEERMKRPGKVAGRDARHAGRVNRQEKRKSKDTVVVQDGHVVVVEDETTARYRSKRKQEKVKKPITIPRKSGKVPIYFPITVRTLSEAIGMKVPELLLRLRKLGIENLTINSGLDVDVAELIAADAECELDICQPEDVEKMLLEDHKQQTEDPSRLEPRAPIVTIMGHVDHGKTSLLDRIRRSNITATEAGGITQVIRAWSVMHDDKKITFLDTPGHEAFTKMRARGAQVTDIAVIVVAADDGVMPQTEEAINHAKAAGVAMVVAINKIDMPNANIKKTEQQLYGLGILPDNMGGDTPFVHTSAVTGQGIDELLEQILLVAELKELKANPHKPAQGVCLEAYLSGDEGVFATLLVQSGTLHRGDIVLCGTTYGRVRAMYNDLGQPIKEAGPSTPVRITGLEAVPEADDPFQVVAELSKAREIAEKRAEKLATAKVIKREPMKLGAIGEKKMAELKVIVKADFRGSIEAIRKELEKLTHDEVRVRILHDGIGSITESDVQLALTSPEDTIVVGFNVVADPNAQQLAEERGITIREYNIIYNLTDDIKAALEGKLKPREEVVHLGRAVVRETFKISKVGIIAGCYVTQGVIERSAKVRVIREGVVVYPPPDRVATLESLKRYKDDVREVREGFDCGMKIANYDDVKVGDVIEAYRIEQVVRKL